MNLKKIQKKVKIALTRSWKKLRRKFIKPKQNPDREARNLKVSDYWNMFNPRICFLMTIKAGRTKAHMAPIKWITETRVGPHKIVMAIFKGGEAERLIRKAKAFSISQVSREYAKDFYRLIKMLPASGTISAVSNFRAEPAFFIDGFKANKLPWAECKLDRILHVDQDTVLVQAEIVHISKNQNSNKNKLIHYQENQFVNTKTMAVKTVDKI